MYEETPSGVFLLYFSGKNFSEIVAEEIFCDMLLEIKKTQTVEAEVTAVMTSQRARGDESRVRNKLSNGPLRARGNAGSRRVFRDVRAYVSCRGYVGILPSARVMP